MATSGAAWEPFGWAGDAGCQTDADTGLVLMGHRLYDSRLGRFLSQDPIEDGTNWYAYTDNNPVNMTDPLGLECAPFDSTGMGFGQIYDYVTSHNGLPGEVYGTYQNGQIIPGSEFIVSGFIYGGTAVVAPYGNNIGNDIIAARQFYHDPSNQKNGKFIPSRAGAYLAGNYFPGNKHGDPHKYGKQYDKYGHAIYAAAASELRVKLDALVQAQVDVHDIRRITLEGENSSGEVLGWRFDQHFSNPGPGLYNLEDVTGGGVGQVLADLMHL